MNIIFLPSINIFVLISFLISFLATVILTKILIPVLTKFKYGQSILKIGPIWHLSKEGTPTMGGIAIILGVFISIFLSLLFFSKEMSQYESKITIFKNFLGLLMAFLFGLIGFIDDFLKIRGRTNQGLNAKSKLVLQFLNTSLYLWLTRIFEISVYGKAITSIFVPFLGNIDFSLFYYVISSLIIVGIVNAVNLTDGIDGLCSCITFINAIGLVIINLLLKVYSFSIVSSSFAGSCLGFLLYNYNPASIFMGDTGSLFFGGILCAITFGSNNIFILLILSSVYILEMLSVIIQVLYFKITKGKRIFKMTPIHHHFEMKGYKETKICVVFSFFTLFFSLIAIIFLKFEKLN